MVKAPSGMHWGKCDDCPPGYDRKAIPNGSNICRECIMERFDEPEKYDEDTTIAIYRMSIDRREEYES